MKEFTSEDFESIMDGIRQAKRLGKLIMCDFCPQDDYEGLNKTHYRTLIYLSQKGPECMRRICEQIGLEAGSFTPVADRLIEDNLIERIRDLRDRRRVQLKLTPEGVTHVCEVKKQVQNHVGELLSPMNDNLYNDFVKAMRTVCTVNDILNKRGISEKRN